MAVKLRVRALTKRFGGITAVDGVNLDIEGSQITGLIGPNGSGKSTFIDLVSRFQPADAGEVWLDGCALHRLPPHQVPAMGLVRTFQLTRVFHRLTVLENLLVAAPEPKRALSLLEMLGLSNLGNHPAGHLSFGQQKLLELATVLMLDPTVILLDEPAAGVHPSLLEVLSQQLMMLRRKGKTILIIEHNMDFLVPLCDRIVVMNAGRILATGEPREILTSRVVREAYLGG